MISRILPGFNNLHAGTVQCVKHARFIKTVGSRSISSKSLIKTKTIRCINNFPVNPLSTYQKLLTSSSPRQIRHYSAVHPDSDLSDYEKQIFSTLKDSLDPEFLDVRDVSGGCGSMFAISVVSPKFSGLTMIKQHRLVNELLQDEIKKWHGLQLKTKAV